jgi:hypothetical protein
MGIGAGTAAVISLAGTALSAGVGAIGAAKTAEAQQASANYQAQVAANNQTVAEQNARYMSQAGQVNAQAQDIQTRATLGREVAGAAASGLDVTTGSPLDVQTGTRELGRLSSLTDIQQGNLQAYGYQTQATGYGATAGLERAQAGFAGQAGGIGAASSILGGASSFASKWSQFQTSGAIGGGTGTGNLTPLGDVPFSSQSQAVFGSGG